MKLTNIKSIVFFLGTILLSTSCIKEEAKNAEADIVSCIVPEGILMRNPVITNNSITLYANERANINNLALHFTLTPGATIIPANDSALDYSTPQEFTIYSEDGQWSKKYIVSVIGGLATVADKFDFEDARFATFPNDPSYSATYQLFYSKRSDGTDMEWGCGNYGFSIIKKKAAYDEYPTYQSNDGYKGKCLALVTRSTGKMGEMFGSPIAAGNLFIGTLNASNLLDAVKATRMGIPFNKVPKKLSGYYKYKRGDVYTDKKGNIIDKEDTFDIYAILYETDDNVEYLDGTNSLTSPNIVMMARIEDKKESDEWVPFSIPFILKPGKSIDMDKLSSGKYNFSIVLSSSIDGAYFNGAVGSTLFVDEMELTCDN